MPWITALYVWRPLVLLILGSEKTVLKSTPQHIQFTHFFMMSYNTDFVEARADDIFDGWVTQFFRDLTPTDESALYSLALDKAIEEAN